MISEEEKEKENFYKNFNLDNCIKRIGDIEKTLYPSNFSVLYSGISRDVLISYVFGSFSGSIILSGVLLETALKEALRKKNVEKYSNDIKFGKLIKNACSEGLISEESMKIADCIRECRNDLAHSNYEDAYGRKIAGLNPTEGWIQDIDRGEKANEDKAKSIINHTKKILLEIFSNQSP